MDRARLADACRTLPLFPLPGTVLMPGSLLPLHVFEPRYRALVADCLRDARPLSVCQIHPAEVSDAPNAPRVLPFAAVGIIGGHHALPDGRFNVLVQPVGRVRIVAERATDHPYRVAEAQLLDDAEVDAGRMAVAGERVRGLFTPLVGRMGENGARVAHALAALPPERVPEALSAVVIRGADARQAFLAEPDPLRRAELVEGSILGLLAEMSGAVVAEA